MLERSTAPDLICLSHLRWNAVFQRPQHLMTCCARERRVYFIEEPIFESGVSPGLDVQTTSGVNVVVPYLPAGYSEQQAASLQRRLLDKLPQRERVRDLILWYY